MEEKDRALLLKDLCARLPHGVICQYNCVSKCDTIVVQRINAQGKLMGIAPTFDGEFGFIVDCTKINALSGNIRPYLRSMSSMTEEEEDEYRAINCYEGLFPCNEDALDFVLSHHLDFRGLIPMGLALEAKEGMYKIK